MYERQSGKDVPRSILERRKLILAVDMLRQFFPRGLTQLLELQTAMNML